jgi:hypothetical protein
MEKRTAEVQNTSCFEKHHYRNDGQLACNSTVSEQQLPVWRGMDKILAILCYICAKLGINIMHAKAMKKKAGF